MRARVDTISTRWRRRVGLMFVAVGALLSLALVGQASAAAPYTSQQITSNAYANSDPVVSQGRIAWIGTDKSGLGLMVYDSLTGVTKNVSPHVSAYSNHPFLAGDLVVWGSHWGGSYAIRAVNLLTGQEQMVATPKDDNEELSTDGTYVAWYDRATPAGPADIYLYNSTNGAAQRITNDALDDYSVEVSDGYVVWERESAVSPGTLVSVMLYDTHTGVTKTLTDNAPRYRGISIDAGRVIWLDGADALAPIRLYDIAKGTTSGPLTTPSRKFFVNLGGNKIVWASDAGAASDIYAYDLTTQTTTQLTSSAASDVFPVTDGRLVAWWTSSGTAAPHVYDLATGYTTQLGTSGVWGGVPHLDLGRIAWTAGLDTAAQVYSAVFPVFDDVPTTNLDFSAIQGLAERRIVGGYAVSRGATEFRAANPVLRAQFAKMVAGALRLQVNENMALPPFTDLGVDDPANLYPHEYVAAVYDAQITLGVTPTKFAPFASISRAQAVTMVYRGVQKLYPGSLTAPPAGYKGSLGNFSADHQAAMQALEFNGVLAGVQGFGAKWSPWVNASRGDLAQILWAIMQKIASH